MFIQITMIRNENVIRKLMKLVIPFRKALEIALENGELSKCPIFKNFPNECCDLTCDLLGYYLLGFGIDSYQTVAGYYCDSSRRHAWLVVNGDIVIDITGDQFNNNLNQGVVIPAVYIGKESQFHRSFCVDRVIEENMPFMNKKHYTGFMNMPNARQKNLKDVYCIIEKYL